MHELQQLGQALTALPAERLNGLQLPERLREAIDEFKRTRSHEGRRRQLQFIGKLMRSVDAEPLHAAVAAERLGPAMQALQLHEAERWRLELVNDDDCRWFAGRALIPPATPSACARWCWRRVAKAALPAGQRHGRAWRELFQFVKLNVARS